MSQQYSPITAHHESAICYYIVLWLYNLGWDCWTFCSNGFARDVNGCEICECNVQVGNENCSPESCEKSPPCQYGFVVDAQGRFL